VTVADTRADFERIRFPMNALEASQQRYKQSSCGHSQVTLQRESLQDEFPTYRQKGARQIA